MTFDRVICVPVCEERETLPGLLESVSLCSQRTLVILIINHRVNAAPSTKEDNLGLMKDLGISSTMLSGGECWLNLDRLSLLVIDRASAGREFTPKQGVGTARKIAAQRAQELISNGQVASPWIWCTDGDALVGADYLEAIPQTSGTVIFPWRHINSRVALQLYELSLRSYALGLSYAGSPYGFPTIGSTIAIHTDTLRVIQGFPDRMAGEDFYLLNKAAKVAPVYYLDRSPVRLRDRDSDRVPFGTGPAVKQIISAGNQRPTYQPELFERLKLWNHLLLTSSDAQLIPALTESFPHSSDINRLERLIRQGCHPRRVITRRFELFDAFRTMRWLHQERETLAEVELRDALCAYPFLPDPPRSLDKACQWLERIEQERLVGQSHGLHTLTGD